MPKLTALLLSLSLAGCATQVQNKNDLFSANPAAQKERECYSYDTKERQMARDMPTTIGLGILGGLFPPLILLTSIGAGASAAASQAALPVKCGLTIDDATYEAQKSSFYEQATAIWIQKTEAVSIIVKPLSKKGRCSLHETKIINREPTLMRYVTTSEICKDDDGMPVIKKENLQPMEIAEYSAPEPEQNKPQ